MKTILIDSGTTNSRIRLVKNNHVIDTVKVKVGVRNTAIDGHNRKLKTSISEAVEQILYTNKLTAKDIKFIVASGMITSDLGLYEIPHINFPATLEDFVKSAVVVEIEEFKRIPCVFIPGAKNNYRGPNEEKVQRINEFDIMRGEEVETIGLLEQVHVSGKGAVVLPGSHTKFVIVDEHQTMLSSLSTLGGETFQSLTKETILSSSLPNYFIDEVNHQFLEKGFDAAENFGLTRSFYQIRLLQLFENTSDVERANYLFGSIIYEDIFAFIKSISSHQLDWIVVGGNPFMRKTFAHLLQKVNQKWKVIEAGEEEAEFAMVVGAQSIALNKMKSLNE